MNTYHVTYFYLATGMEGIADERDYGLVEAASKDEAKQKVMKKFNIPDWGLSVTLVSSN